MHKNNLRRINRFLNIQKGTIRYYEKAAFTTTDEKLKVILDRIISTHKKIRKPLLNKYVNQNNLFGAFRKVSGFLERIHRNFFTALIANSQSKILEYVWQSETKMLQEIYSMLEIFQDESSFSSLLQDYQQQVESNLASLDNNINETKESENNKVLV